MRRFYIAILIKKLYILTAISTLPSRLKRLKAKQNIISGINSGDKTDSKWWLERKAKDEFSTKQETEHKNTNYNHELPVSKETLQEVNDLLEK
jgi:hypothetical protein